MEQKKYKLGYYSVMLTTDMCSIEKYMHLKECSSLCEQFVIGIPDEYIAARIFGDKQQYSSNIIKNILMDLKWVTNVIIVNKENISRQKMFEELSYDLCFYGSEYGIQFEEDKNFMKSKGIDFLSVVPKELPNPYRNQALEIALKNVKKEQKIVLFGTGVYFELYMKHYGKQYKPSYAVDNSSEKWNTSKNGILIKKPTELQTENTEDLLIIICSKKYSQMVLQLKELGEFNYRTLLNNDSIALLDEFFIVTDLEQIYLAKSHNILMTLLNEFDRICRKYNLKYYVICGSLIGVIRHQDFIPWDDDIDIAMTREDFEQLRKFAHEEWNTDEFLYLDYDELGNGAFLDCLHRLFYMKENLPTKACDKVYGKATADINNRMFIDIYVLDNASRNDRKHMFIMRMLKGIYALCMGHRAGIDYTEYEKIPKVTLLMLKSAHLVGRCIPLKLLVLLYECLRIYANKEQCEDFYMANCAVTCIERKFKKSYFGVGTRKPMRELEVLVPSDYDGLLKAMGYGNYMEFPSLTVQKPSHYFSSDITIW